MSHEIDPVRSPKTARSKQEGVIFLANQPVVRRIVEGLTFLVAPDIQVNGKENLKEAITVTGGKNLIFMLNHLSNFDTPAFELSLRRAGFGEIVPKLIYLQGIKLDRNPVAKIFLGAFNRIRVWPPSLPVKNEKEKEERQTMTRKSLDSSKKALQEGYILAIYGQGGRSYSGKLTPAEPAVIHYLTLQPNTVVVPVAISGTEEVLPPGSFILLPAQITVDFGEPIRVNSLMKEYQNFPRHERRKRIADFIMRDIAKRLPPKYRGVYS